MFKKIFKKMLKFKAVSVVSLISVALVLGGSIWAYSAMRGVGASPLILHFDDIQGITSVGSIGTIMFVGILGFVVTLMNFAIALELEERDRFLGKIAAAVTFIFAVLLFVAFTAMISVN